MLTGDEINYCTKVVFVAKSDLRVARHNFSCREGIEMAMLALAIAYVSTLVADLNLSPHFGGVAVLIAWLDFFFMLGRFPTVGHYIFMCWTVTKMIL